MPLNKHLEIENIFKTFSLQAGFFSKQGKYVHAVNGISFTIYKGESFGIVGESGSGKSTLSRLLVKANSFDSGKIVYYGQKSKIDYDSKKKLDKIEIRNKIKYVFQDPTSSLDPRMNVKQLLSMGLKRSLKKTEIEEKIKNKLELVGLQNDILDRLPSSFSGGQKQRISLARALMYDPEILICDEVVSALDVSIRSQIINLLIELKQKLNLTIIFIAHDLSVVSYICDRIAVLYGGKIMEIGETKKIFNNPKHPYTKLLIKSIPSINKDFINTEQDTNFFNPLEEVKGCPFYNRCQISKYLCYEEVKTKEVDEVIYNCNF